MGCSADARKVVAEVGTDFRGIVAKRQHRAGRYNWQMNHVVFGLRSRFAWTGISGSVTASDLVFGAAGGSACFTNMQWLNTDRGAPGHHLESISVYVTGGLAGASIRRRPAVVRNANRQATLANDPSDTLPSCGTQHRWAGTSVARRGQPTLLRNGRKIEYLYADFGTKQSYTVVIPVNVSEKVNIRSRWHQLPLLSRHALLTAIARTK